MTTAGPDQAWRGQALTQLLQSVHDEPWAHDFFALVRRLDSLRPQAPRTGQALRPAQEALRFAQPPELDFAPAPLSRLELRDGAVPRLSVRFFGLLGPHGPMPLHITEYVRERVHQHGDTAAAHFLDLFHHRLLSLFYAAWAQAQPVVHADRPQDDRYRVWLGAAAGLPDAALPGTSGQRGAVPAPALAFQAGLLSARSRHPEALCKVLGQYFGVPVAVQPHVGQWLAIDVQDRSRLGRCASHSAHQLHSAAQLGHSANAGSRVWDRQYRFRLQLGTLSLPMYLGFLPGAPAWQALTEWVTLLAGAQLRWELELRLRDAERPAPRLGRSGMRLGVTSWLARRPRAGATAAVAAAAAAAAAIAPGLRIRPATCFLQRLAQPTPA